MDSFSKYWCFAQRWPLIVAAGKGRKAEAASCRRNVRFDAVCREHRGPGRSVKHEGSNPALVWNIVEREIPQYGARTTPFLPRPVRDVQL
jgi:hypothetical protein